MKFTLPLLATLALTACGLTDEQIDQAMADGVAAAEGKRVSDAVATETDMDAVAQKTVNDFDTTGFDALSN